MQSIDKSSASRVAIDEGSVLAHFAEWQSRSKNRPVAAMGDNSSEPALFVADEVIVDARDEELVTELTRAYGAEVVSEAAIPEIPEPLRRHRRRIVDLESMPDVVRLRFASAPPVDNPEAVLTAAFTRAATGRHRAVTISSNFGARVAALVAQLARPSVGLNYLANTFAMPLSTATEGLLANSFQYPAFAGSSRMVDAWQLVDSIRQLTGNRFITVGILDGGFWLDNAGTPIVASGQSASDFGTGVMQMNLQNESLPAGGMNPNTCTGGSSCRWHGNGVASAAAATINNQAGAAGSAGNVALPFLFRSDLSVDQILRCVRICTAWGIDVLNMSFGFTSMFGLFFVDRAWNSAFQFASDNGVVMIASAGNDGVDIGVNLDRRPATLTPGVLTVGWLDPADNADPRSNYGAPVKLWAPGTAIPVAPDADFSAGSTANGTSLSAPIVAGVAAMMRFANDALSAADIRQTLVDSGWAGTGRVSKGLDAGAAVLAAIRGTLPDTNEANNTPSTAREIFPIRPGGPLGPGIGGFTARSTTSDSDYWTFRVDAYSTVSIAVDWYERLNSLSVELKAAADDTPDPDGMTTSTSEGGVVIAGFLPPGVYGIWVGGGLGITGYRLLVTRQATALSTDDFEDNDSFDRAARLLFESTKWTIGARTWAPGTYDATLHQERSAPRRFGVPAPLVMNDDYFRLKVPAGTAGRRPRVAIHKSDQLLDVVLYDAAHTVLETWPRVRKMFVYPPPNSTCFLKVSALVPTRYRITTRMTVDMTVSPGIVKEEMPIMPKWWGHPGPVEITDIVTHFAVDVNSDRGDGEMIAFERPSMTVRIELLDAAGSVARQADAVDGKLVIDTRGIEPGSYVMRISKADEAPHARLTLRTAPSTSYGLDGVTD